MTGRNTLGFALLFSAAAACAPKAPPPIDEAPIRAAITAQLQKFLPAFASKNAGAVKDFFTEDATWILPDASTFIGRANIEAGAKGFFSSFESATMGEVKLDRLVVVSDTEAVSFAHGTFTMTVKGKPEAHINPFADHWKKGADGTWRVAYEVNADGPAPAPAK